MGRLRLYDSLDCGRWSDSSCWLAAPVLERLQWRFHRRACKRELWLLDLTPAIPHANSIEHERLDLAETV
jgi:hypothetical protein